MNGAAVDATIGSVGLLVFVRSIVGLTVLDLSTVGRDVLVLSMVGRTVCPFGRVLTGNGGRGGGMIGAVVVAACVANGTDAGISGINACPFDRL